MIKFLFKNASRLMVTSELGDYLFKPEVSCIVKVKYLVLGQFFLLVNDPQCLKRRV